MQEPDSALVRREPFTVLEMNAAESVLDIITEWHEGVADEDLFFGPADGERETGRVLDEKRLRLLLSQYPASITDMISVTTRKAWMKNNVRNCEKTYAPR